MVSCKSRGAVVRLANESLQAGLGRLERFTQLIDRDLVFVEVKKALHRALRDCVRRAQPGFHALATAIAASLPR